MSAEPRPRSIAARVRSWFLGEEFVAEGGELPQAAVTLQDDWRRESLAAGWFSPADWWDPACDAVVERLLAGDGDVEAGLARLGRARGELGCTIEETLDDVAALYRVTSAGEPPLAGLRAVCSGWAEAGLRDVGAASCFDSVTGLATRAYLEARLGELYRDGSPGHPADRLCVVLVDINVPASLDALPGLHRTSEALRRSFTQGHTIARIGQGRFAALAPVGPGLPGRLQALETLLGDNEDGLVAAVWVESLPRTFGLVRGLLEDLSR